MKSTCPSTRIPGRSNVFVGLLLFLTLSSSPATAQKQYGFNSTAGNGRGEKLTFGDFHRVSVAIRAISMMTVEIKEGVTYDGLDIALDLIRMQLDGRMGRGVGASAANKAAVLMDGLATAAGDRMNIADHFLDSATKAELVSVLAHEWLHTRQTSPNVAVREAPAYQVSQATYILAGGAASDPMYTTAVRNAAGFKLRIPPPAPGLMGGRASTTGAVHVVSEFRRQYHMLQTPGVLLLAKDEVAIDSVVANPGEVYFDVLMSPVLGGIERLLVFGADLSDPFNPLGTLTVVDADSNGFLMRRDSTFANLRYPFSATRDTVTGKFYVLDAHFSGPGIVVLIDANADFVPDVQLATPFAPSGFMAVDSARSIRWAEHPVHGPGLALDTTDVRGAETVHPGSPIRHLIDTNGDDVVDGAPFISESELHEWAPTFTIVPDHDDTSVELYGIGGHPVEIRSTDGTGDPDFGVLGGGLMTTAGQPTQFVLSRALVFGEYIICVDLMNNWRPALPMQVGIGTVSAGDPRASASIGMAVFPNPGSRVRVAFDLPRAERVDLGVYDVTGRRVAVLASQVLAAGRHVRDWSGRDGIGRRVHAGVYFLGLRVGRERLVRRVALLD